MKLTITEDRLISDIQADFNDLFPYLKLEFFRRSLNPQHPEHVLKADSRIGDVTYGLQEGYIQLSDSMAASDIEETFDDRFGLHVHVCRKSA